MTVHELATNAAKYGAFSHRAANGRIDVTWSLGPVEGKKVRLHFRWREHGLIIPANRTRRGFGTEIIEDSVPYLFGGSSTLSFYADGIECLINAALPQQEVTTERVNRA